MADFISWISMAEQFRFFTRDNTPATRRTCSAALLASPLIGDNNFPSPIFDSTSLWYITHKFFACNDNPSNRGFNSFCLLGLSVGFVDRILVIRRSYAKNSGYSYKFTSQYFLVPAVDFGHVTRHLDRSPCSINISLESNI